MKRPSLQSLRTAKKKYVFQNFNLGVWGVWISILFLPAVAPFRECGIASSLPLPGHPTANILSTYSTSRDLSAAAAAALAACGGKSPNRPSGVDREHDAAGALDFGARSAAALRALGSYNVQQAYHRARRIDHYRMRQGSSGCSSRIDKGAGCGSVPTRTLSSERFQALAQRRAQSIAKEGSYSTAAGGAHPSSRAEGGSGSTSGSGGAGAGGGSGASNNGNRIHVLRRAERRAARERLERALLEADQDRARGGRGASGSSVG